MATADLPEAIRAHAETLSWIDIGIYLHSRGWYANGGGWVSPHDGLTYREDIPCYVEEALRESLGIAITAKEGN